MAKVVLGTEVNLPEITQVRVSQAIKSPGKILAVHDPIFGWMNYRSYGILKRLESIIKDIGPMELVAWVGLTFTYAATIKSAGDFAGWVNQVAGDVGGIFTQIAAALAPFFDPGGLSQLPAADLGGVGAGIQQALGSVFGSLGNAPGRYLWSAVAASLTILAFP